MRELKFSHVVHCYGPNTLCYPCHDAKDHGLKEPVEALLLVYKNGSIDVFCPFYKPFKVMRVMAEQKSCQLIVSDEKKNCVYDGFRNL